MLVFGGGATIHSRPVHMRIRRLFEAPVPLLTELRLPYVGGGDCFTVLIQEG